LFQTPQRLFDLFKLEIEFLLQGHDGFLVLEFHGLLRKILG
jgi:hypothetical protein